MTRNNLILVIVIVILASAISFIAGRNMGHPRFTPNMMQNVQQNAWNTDQQAIQPQNADNQAPISGDQQPPMMSGDQQPPMVSGDQQPTQPTPEEQINQ